MTFDRRYRRSSDPMIALWCLLDHVCKRYCLQSAVLIDDFGHELVSAGEAWAAVSSSEEESVSDARHAASLPGRKLPGLVVVRGPRSVLRPALEDIEQGMHRVFHGEQPESHDHVLTRRNEALGFDALVDAAAEGGR